MRGSLHGRTQIGSALKALAGALLAALALSGLGGCDSVGDRVGRRGTEIMVCGQLYDIGAPVVLWIDPGGYDGYRVERRFVPWDEAGWDKSHAAGIAEPQRYGLRFGKGAAREFTPEQFERVRGGGWDLGLLQKKVDQFVLHYDVCGTSRECFHILHDVRGLSVHFMLDLDGTIYQTLDVKERAFHATVSNDRSVGVEIANIGAYGTSRDKTPLSEWYVRDEKGRTRIAIPPRLGDGGLRTGGFVGRPMADGPVEGEINGSVVRMYDFTPQQYDSLVKLASALCTLLPGIRPEVPRDGNGRPRTGALTGAELEKFQGILGHYHVQQNKIDPGPAMRWDWLVDRVQVRMGRQKPDGLSRMSASTGLSSTDDPERRLFRNQSRRAGALAGR